MQADNNNQHEDQANNHGNINNQITNDITITQSAIDRILAVAGKKYQQNPKNNNNQDEKYFLRFFVEAGGCYGFSYIFKFDNNLISDDVIIKDENGSVVCALNPKIIKLVKGSVLDFIEDLSSSYFTVKSNPNSTGGCGCGNSFSINA